MSHVIDPLTGLFPTHCHACPKSGSGLSKSYKLPLIVVFCELRWEVIFRFVDFGGINDHHCLDILLFC